MVSERYRLSDDNIKLILKRKQYAQSKDSSWEWLLRRAYELSQPNRNLFQRTTADGANKNWQVYDPTLVLATRRFVNRMQQALVPDSINWMQFAPGDEIILSDESQEFQEAVKDVLQKRTDLFFRYLKRSNFYTSINEAFYDLSVGTSALQCNETGNDDKPFVFESIPMDRIYFCEGPYGTLDAVFRDHYDMPLYNAETVWPGFKLPENYAGKGQDPYEIKLCLYECAYYDYKIGMYRYCVIEKSTGKAAFEEEPSESWPFIVFRWYKLPGEIRGRGPVIDAYPSAATINKVMQDEILAADLMSKPIYMGFSDGLFNPDTFRIAANTVITVNPIASGGQWPLTPLPTAGRVEYAAIVLNDLRSMIDKIMFNSPLGPIVDAPPLTATEITIRQNEMLEDAAASFLRLQKEFFEPLITRILYILKRRGLFDPIEVDGRLIDIKYQTPLSLGKGQLEVNQFMLWWQNQVNILGPQAALMTIDFAKIPHWMAEQMNVYLPIIKKEVEIQQSIQEMMQQAANQVGGLSAGTTEPTAIQ